MLSKQHFTSIEIQTQEADSWFWRFSTSSLCKILINCHFFQP